MRKDVPKERLAPGIIRKTLDPREWKWRLLEKGHEKPRKIYRTLEEAEKRVSNAEFALISRICSFGGLLELEKEMVEYREAEKGKGDYQKLVEQNEILKKEALVWMDEEYVGERVFMRMQETPPLLITFVSSPVSYLSLDGAYHIGTNCIHTDDALLRSFEQTDTRMLQISHELHHYAAWLGGGMGIRWRDSKGNPHFRNRVRHLLGRNVRNEPLNESLTITLSKQEAYTRGIFWDSEVDNDEVMLGLMLQGIAGEKEVRMAYFSGDFSEIFAQVEGKLGKGTFSRILEYLDEPYDDWKALKLIVEKINARGAQVGTYWEDGLGKVIFKGPDNKRFIPAVHGESS